MKNFVLLDSRRELSSLIHLIYTDLFDTWKTILRKKSFVNVSEEKKFYEVDSVKIFHHAALS